LWINHGTHHYKNGEMVFGVSSPLWDYLYGTMNKPIRRKHSQSVRTYDEINGKKYMRAAASASPSLIAD
jgi:sterol desaturase/sphingolipid hydroxylase (fatty acid hydroxylase superfamily)